MKRGWDMIGSIALPGTISRARVAMCVLMLSACAGRTAPAPQPREPEIPAEARTTGLPPIPAVDGPLVLDVAYPQEGAALAVRDSNFIYGSTGSGRASLSINGSPVAVKPNGAWLAYIPVPRDGVYRLQASRAGDTASFERRIRIAPMAAAFEGVRIIPGTVSPSGPLAVWRDELVEISFMGTAGGSAWLVLPWGRRFPLVESRLLAAAANNAADFQIATTATPGAASGVSRYSGVFPAVALHTRDTTIAQPRLGSMPFTEPADSLLERCAAAAAAGRLDNAPRCGALTRENIEQYQRTHGGEALVELAVGPDTARERVSLNLTTLHMPRVGVVASPDSSAEARRNFRARGRYGTAGPFEFFWPHGTLLAITGQRGNQYRVRLAPDHTAWIPAADVRLLPEGTPPPGGGITTARLAPQADRVDVRIGLPQRLPYHVQETGPRSLQIDVYGGTSLVNFFQFGSLDPLIERAHWSQPADSIFRVSIELSQQLWGYQAFHDQGGGLVVRVRRPPAIDPDQPLRGLLIAVDAGHGGHDSLTVGPTRLTEANANLAIALALRDQLEAAGARVLMTRTTNIFIDLNLRPQIAEDADADLLVSVHNNAFPDGVNPFGNNGTSVYFYQMHSIDLARDLERSLLNELRLRDIGYGRADLALVRPTWMPSALTETAFMMVPEQEAALRDPDVQQRIARAHVRALEAFLRGRAGAR